MYKKVSLVLFCGVVLITIFFGLEKRWRQEDRMQTIPLRPAPDFTLQDISGADVRLSSYQGRVVMVNLWATWCPFCLAELADMARAQKEFGEKMVVIAVNRGEPFEKITKYIREAHLDGLFLFLQDPSDSVYQSLGGFSMPETIFVDRDGMMRDRRRGPMNLEEIRRRVENIL